MNGSIIIRSGGKLAALTGLVVAVCLSGCGPKPAPPAAPAKPPAAAAKPAATSGTATNGVDQYTSVFEDLPPPQGKDPFFPTSHRRVIKTEVVTPTDVVRADPVLILTAIIRTARRSQAVLNNAIFEVGEEQPVHVPNGKVKVKCLEIGKNYVLVQVEGEAEPKRLMMEHKKQ
jgi:hypothetical protein